MTTKPMRPKRVREAVKKKNPSSSTFTTPLSCKGGVPTKRTLASLFYHGLKRSEKIQVFCFSKHSFVWESRISSVSLRVLTAFTNELHQVRIVRHDWRGIEWVSGAVKESGMSERVGNKLSFIV